MSHSFIVVTEHKSLVSHVQLAIRDFVNDNFSRIVGSDHSFGVDCKHLGRHFKFAFYVMLPNTTEGHLSLMATLFDDTNYNVVDGSGILPLNSFTHWYRYSQDWDKVILGFSHICADMLASYIRSMPLWV